MPIEAEKYWLIQSGSEPAGPYSLAQLRRLARSGRISRATLIRDLRTSDWLVAGQLPEIFQQAAPATTAADQAKPKPMQTTPSLLVSPRAFAPPVRVGKSTPVPRWFGPNQDITQSRPVVIVATTAGAVGSAVIGLLIFFSLLKPTPQRPTPSAPDGDIATATAATSASTANLGSKTSVASNQSAVYSTEELVSRTQQSVAAVITNQGSGSGFMVGPNVMATNYHVIADSLSNEIAVVFPDGEKSKQGPFQATIIAEQPDRDLALMRIDAEIPALEVYPDYRFRRGQDVVIMGTPALFRGQDILPNAVTRGVLSSQAQLDGFEHFQLSLAVNSGNSGGPVFGMDGRVIGVVVSKSLTEDSIGFCIPAPDLQSLIQSEENTNFAPTAKAAALHDARRLIRVVVNQLLTRNDVMAESLALIRVDLSTASASRFVQEMKQISQTQSPDLFKSYESELSTLSQNSLLSFEVQRAISGIQRRHVAMDRLLRSPSGNIERFANQLRSLEGDFLDHLSVVNGVLEIGRPELLSQ